MEETFFLWVSDDWKSTEHNIMIDTGSNMKIHLNGNRMEKLWQNNLKPHIFFDGFLN